MTISGVTMRRGVQTVAGPWFQSMTTVASGVFCARRHRGASTDSLLWMSLKMICRRIIRTEGFLGGQRGVTASCAPLSFSPKGRFLLCLEYENGLQKDKPGEL